MKFKDPIPTVLAATMSGILIICGSIAAPAEEPLSAGAPVVLPGTHGKFDFLAIDLPARRLLAAHTGNGSLDVIDLDTREVVKIVPTGKAQSSAVDAKTGSYYVGSSEPAQLVTIDAAKLEVTNTVPLRGPADLIACDSQSGKVYVGHDDGQDLWVVDPAQKKVTASIHLPGEAPEDLAFDMAHRRLFQSMKTGDIVAVIDLATGTVEKTWPTAPAQSPHGMAVVPESDALLIAGGNGKLVMMSQKDGREMASTDIPPRVDQIAYDADLHRVYCASGTGKIAIVSVENGTLRNVGEVASAPGAHSIAVDPKTHVVWIAYAKDETSIVQPFTQPK
jgi:DNA-binding beta-propeller fold protein YncE